MTRPLLRSRPALALALLLSTSAAALAQGAAGGGGGGGAEQKSESGEARPGVTLPVIGRIPLPGFLAGLFGEDESKTEQAAGSENGGGGQNGEGAANGEPAAVIVEQVETRSVGDTFSFIGTIQPIEQVGIRARVEGYIQEVHFTGGQRVKEGDLLFQIEPAQYEASVRAAEAQLSGAQATLNQAQRDFDRQQGLTQSGVTARATLDTATATLENAQASFLQAQAALTQAQLNLSYTRISAAIAGEMSQPLITRGNYVSSTSGDLATLTQMDPIWGVFPIGEGQLVTWQRVGIGAGEAAPIETVQNGRASGAGGSGGGDTAQAGSGGGGQGDGGGESAEGDGEDTAGSGEAAAAELPTQAPADAAAPTDGGTLIASADGTGAAGAPPPPEGSDVNATAEANDGQIGADYNLNLRLPNGATYEPAGRFDYVGNTVNAATGTVEARIRFPNPGGFLLANQNVSLAATQKNPPVLPVISQAAIQLSREGRSVLVVKDDDTIERRRIEVSPQAVGNMAAITSGLQGGERIVVRGSANVKEGAHVRPLTQAQADAEAQARRNTRSAQGEGESGGGGGETSRAPEGGVSQSNGQGGGSGGQR